MCTDGPNVSKAVTHSCTVMSLWQAPLITSLCAGALRSTYSWGGSLDTSEDACKWDENEHACMSVCVEAPAHVDLLALLLVLYY